MRRFNGCRAAWFSVGVFVVCLAGACIISKVAEPLPTYPDDTAQRASMTLLATVTTFLAAGCLAGFFAFSYENAQWHERRAVQFAAYLFIGAIAALTCIALYCLGKLGVFQLIGPVAVAFLFLGTFALIDGVVLLERWDSTTLPDANAAPGQSQSTTCCPVCGCRLSVRVERSDAGCP